MRNKGIHQALNELIGERRRQDAPDLFTAHSDKSLSSNSPAPELTFDISRSKAMTGLNILAEALIKSIIEHSVFSRSDILIEQRVDPDLQAELYQAGVTNICFYTRLSILENLPRFYDTVGYQVRYMLNAIQDNEIYDLLFPEAGTLSRGALFPFNREDGSDVTGFFYLIEYVAIGRFLRITLESEQDSRLRMTRIPHVPVQRIDMVYTRVDIPGTAAIIAQGLTEACSRQSRNYTLGAAQIKEYMVFLNKAGLADLEVITFTWPDQFSRLTLSSTVKRLQQSIMRILFVLGDSRLIPHLIENRPIRLIDGESDIYVDLSQRRRCLNLSILEPRNRVGLPDYLQRMPALHQAAIKFPDAFQNTRILYIHHLTREILGSIQAMTEMGAVHIETLWVKYAGIVEPEYKEAILSLPELLYKFRGLTPVIEEDGIQCRYLLSEQFSSIENLTELAAVLRDTPYHFFEAMRLTAGHLFLNMVIDCRRDNQSMILIEDGGYIASTINQFCLDNQSLRDVVQALQFPLGQLTDEDLNQPFRDWIAPVYIGSVEHTRNGFDALRKIEDEYGQLAFPASTIALSTFKSTIESRDVVYSCVNAVESIMNGMGFSLSERCSLVLGAQGTIGRRVMDVLIRRVGSDHLFGVDIVFPPEPPAWTWAIEPAALMDDAMRRIDFIFGVTGVSICKAEWVEQLLLSTEKQHLFFASGSTKTAEFADLTDWLSELANQPEPTIGDLPLETSISEICDPKTGAHQGRSFHLSFGDKTVHCHLLADLMPVNFLYYGVPSETMNYVMIELLILSAAMLRRHRENRPLPPRLLALDHQITIEGELIEKE